MPRPGSARVCPVPLNRSPQALFEAGLWLPANDDRPVSARRLYGPIVPPLRSTIRRQVVAGATDLAVVIPTRQRWEPLAVTLRALQEQTEAGFETIVVVDGSDQAVPELSGVTTLQQDHAGPGAARNRGAEATERPLILFIGDDMVPTPDLVARHLWHHRACPDREVAVLGRVEWHPSVPRTRLHKWLARSRLMFDFPSVIDEPDVDAGWGRFFSCNLSIKRELFLAAGGFDPDFLFDYEDTDMGWRLNELGFRLIYEPRALVHHLHTYDWASLQRRVASRAVGERLMLAKHDSFEPWFYSRFAATEQWPPISRFWPLVVDFIPHRLGGLRKLAEEHTDRHYRQRLAPAFLAAWNAGQATSTTISPSHSP